MAKFAMARSAIALIRFMTVSPFHEASNFDRLQLVKRTSLTKRDRLAKLFHRDDAEANGKDSERTARQACG
jgi:hypothetical protein